MPDPQPGMIRVKDNAGLHKEATAQAARLQQARDDLEVRQRALRGPRKVALWITQQWWFGQLSLSLIVGFSIMLAFFDPTDPDNLTPGNQLISKMEKIFIGIFTAEVLIVWMAEGLFIYFKEPWNTLDFIIVGVGYLSLTPVGANLGALRTIRLLRPLRSLKRIESMRRLVNSMLGSLPGLVNVGGMIFAFIFVTSLFGVKMFKGIMRFGCVPTGDYEASVERALLVADMECAKCMATCTALHPDVLLDAQLCSQVTVVGNSSACDNVVYQNGARVKCVYVEPAAPEWTALPFVDLMLRRYDSPVDEDAVTANADGDGELDATELANLWRDEKLPVVAPWQCAICQATTAHVSVEISIQERFGGRPQTLGSTVVNKSSCTLAVDPSAVDPSEADCLAAGRCELSGSAGSRKCTAATYRAQHLEQLTAVQLVDYLGVPDKVEEMDLRAYGGDQYEKVCNGFLQDNEDAAGYDKYCVDKKPDSAFRIYEGHANDVCGLQPRDCPCDCMDGYICMRDGGPNYGISSFDHMGKAMLTVFQIMTLEGWTEILDRLTDTSSDPLVIIYFVVIVWGGAFFLTHYMLAMICLEFTKKLKGTLMAEEEMNNSSDDGPSGIFDPAQGGCLNRCHVPTAPWMAWYTSCHRMCATDPVKSAAQKAKKTEAFVWWSASFRQLDDKQKVQANIYQKYPQPLKGEVDVLIRQWPPTDRWPAWAELTEAQRNAATELGMSEETWPPLQPGHFQAFRNLIIKFTSLPTFDSFINSIIVVNFVMLAVDHHGMDVDVVELFEQVNGVLTYIFAAEMSIKMVGYGLGTYFSDKFNCFDCFIVVTSLTEKMMEGGGSFSVLRTLRLLRILRSFKMMSGLDTLKKMIATTAGSMSAIANFAVLLMLLLYIFALVGMQMFGGKLEIDGETARPHFDNLIWSFTSVFLVMTRENWQALLYDTMYASGPIAFLYYYTLIISTSYVLLALFVGTLLENFEQFFLQGAREKQEQKERIIDKKALNIAFGKKGGGKFIALADEDMGAMAQKWKGNGLKKPAGAGANALGAFGGTPSKYVAEADDKAPEPPPVPKGPTLCARIASKIRSVRDFAKQVVENRWFETAVISSILISSGCLAYEHPLDPKDGLKVAILEVLDLFFIYFFTFEMSMKILALGLVRGPEAYLRSGWNMLDGFIVVTSLIVLITKMEGGFFRIIRTVRVLRPLRAIQRSKGMRAVAGGLFKAVPSIATVAALVFFFMLICAIFCVQMFKGTMYTCTDPTCGSFDQGGCGNSDEEWDEDLVKALGGDAGQNCPIWACHGTFIDPESGELQVSEWVNQAWNFDNVPNALLTLFEIFALEAWPDILIALVDATDECHGPMKDSQVGVVWLFVIMIMFGAFFLLNLFVGVIVTAYNELQSEEEEDEFEKVRRHEKRWHDDLVELASFAIPQKLVYLDFKYRGPFMRITNARSFEPFVMFIIVLNVCTMGIDWADDNGSSPPDLVKVLEYVNLLFTYSFAIEMVIKLISYYPAKYFCDAWNVFDFIITMVSLVETVFTLPLNPTLIRIFRIFRLARLLRLSKKAKGLKTLMKTFSATLPSLGHVGFLLMIFFFMYAVLGVQMFWNLQRGEMVNDYTNFDNFANALYTLFRLSTGENWNGVMHACMLSPPDCHYEQCVLDTGTIEVDGIAADGSVWAGGKNACIDDLGGDFVHSDCGTGAGAAYHITFLVICAFTTLNLIIAVILFAFFDFSESDKKPTLGGDKIGVFEDAWAKFDKNAEGELPFSLIPRLLVANGLPLGVKKFDEAHDLEQELWETELLFDYNGKIKFTEFLHATIKAAYGVDCRAALLLKRETSKRRAPAAQSGAADTSVDQLVLPDDVLETSHLVGELSELMSVEADDPVTPSRDSEAILPNIGMAKASKLFAGDGGSQAREMQPAREAGNPGTLPDSAEP